MAFLVLLVVAGLSVVMAVAVAVGLLWSLFYVLTALERRTAGPIPLRHARAA